MKPKWKYDWFWFVALPTVLIAIVFMLALLMRVVT